MKGFLLLSFLILSFFSFSLCDLPVHCEFPQIQGVWNFHLSEYKYSKEILYTDCQLTAPFPSSRVPLWKSKAIQLGVPNRPDVAVDVETGTLGTWTLTYDQSFEVVFGDFRYLAFFNYTQQGTKIISHCDQTFTGWYNKIEVNAPRFGCMRAVKQTEEPVHTYQLDDHISSLPRFSNTLYPYDDPTLINLINSAQSGWKAGPAYHLKGKTLAEAQRHSGTPLAPFRIKAHQKHMAFMRSLQDPTPARARGPQPKFFDWRNVNGRNFVTPVRDQGNCGSCYSFASCGMLEARFLVQTNLSIPAVTFSPQDIIECSPFSQGCAGGFPEQVAKYGEAWGIALEQYDPYTGNQSQCHKWDYDQRFARVFTTNYFYVGPDGKKAYYGASTEEGMIINLLEKGPIAVSIMVYSDFQHYRSGVYRHLNQTERSHQSPILSSSSSKEGSPDPHFVITNHVILVVGYGETEQGDKYWIIKNSWGTGWGMNGFGWIARGVDEVGIESMPISADIVIDFNSKL